MAKRPKSQQPVKYRPINRKSEVLALFLEHPGQWLTYLFISRELMQNNAHRYITWLEEDGIKFHEKVVPHTNRYGKGSFYKMFKLRAPAKAAKMFNAINKQNGNM